MPVRSVFESIRIEAILITRIHSCSITWIVVPPAFWAYAKTRLARYRGMSPSTFYLHLEECEFRFNHRDQNLNKILLTLCRTHPLS